MILPKVTIQIVTWNSKKYLPFTLASIFSQTYQDFQALIIDNDSHDGTVDFIRKNYPEVTVFQNKKNLGFAKANNQGLNLLHSPYVLFCNPDVVLDKTWLSVIMLQAQSPDFQGVASWGGKLLKLKPNQNEIDETSKTDIIDSCGLKILDNRQIIDLGAGQHASSFEKQMEVFGQSGALVLYRRPALDQALLKSGDSSTREYFDNDFFAYKEDVDLAWRVRLLGWQSMFVPEAIAYHVRALSGASNASLTALVKNRQKQSALSRYYSYRNHFLLLLKNEYLGNFFHDFWRIKWFEAKKAVYVLIFEFKNIKAWWAVLRLMPKMLAKRRAIFKIAKINSQAMAQWLK